MNTAPTPTVRPVEVVRRVWLEVVSTQPAPTQAQTWVAVLAALAVVALPVTWRRTRVVVTVAHEGAHAAVAVLCGRRLAGVRVHTDSSGLTLSRGRPRGPGMVATAAAGYPGPALLGLAAALLLGTGRALAVLWLAVLLLAALLVWVRNAYGLLAVGAALALVGSVTWWAEPRWQSPWRTSAAGSSCSAPPGPRSSWPRPGVRPHDGPARGARAARPAASPTPTCSPGSPTYLRGSGSACSC